MEWSIGILVTIVIAVLIVNGWRVPTWFARARLFIAAVLAGLSI